MRYLFLLFVFLGGCCLSPYWKNCGASDQEIDYWQVTVNRSDGNVEHYLESGKIKEMK